MQHRHHPFRAGDLLQRRLRTTAGKAGRSAADRRFGHRVPACDPIRPWRAATSARASPSPMPDAPTDSRWSSATSPMVSRSRSNTASTMAAPMPLAPRDSPSRARTASGPRTTVREIDQADLGPALARQHPHQIGIVHRVERMILQRAFVQRHRADEQIALVDGAAGLGKCRRHQHDRIAGIGRAAHPSPDRYCRHRWN